MTYDLIITETATKELKRIPPKMQDRLFEKIEGLAQEPKPQGYKKLKNFSVAGNDASDYFRIRVGNYRVIYTIDNEQITIFVFKIAHRKDVYK